jgi:uncharacterized protein
LRYLDSSAIVKLILAEEESGALQKHLRDGVPRASCAIAHTEVLRAVGPHGRRAVETARFVLRSIRFIAIDESLLVAAGELRPWALRSLDALHVAAALALVESLNALVTYDRRMADAATALGMKVESPGAAG